jgi:hypothetical protein
LFGLWIAFSIVKFKYINQSVTDIHVKLFLSIFGASASFH